MNKELKLIFEKFLDGKKATVKSGNLSSEASIEGEIELKVGYTGEIDLLTTLQWNKYKILEKLKTIYHDNISSYKETDLICKKTEKLINSFKIKIGTIHLFRVKEFTIEYREDVEREIDTIYIKYEDNSITEIFISRNQINYETN